MSSGAVVGVDFDNTIVCYDGVFFGAARELDLVPADLPPTKQCVRDYLRHVGREAAWTELQGYVYGVRMADAEPYPGVLTSLARWRRVGVRVVVISHKTRHPYAGPRYDLHEAALQWMEQFGFFDSELIGLNVDQVFLELTKEAKVSRIRALGCTHFMDDLPEFLAEPEFPSDVQRILFDPHRAHPPDARWRRIERWEDAQHLVAEQLGGL